MSYIVLILFIVMNIAGLLIMKVDKKRAVKHQYRISERTLWLFAIFGGAIGCTLGMNTYRHKTKHLAFKIGFPFLAIVEVVLFVYFLYLS
jgi:uncharacterized membrane protein YsdA (DUF1294 family)